MMPNHCYAAVLALTLGVVAVTSISDYNWRQCFPYYQNPPWTPAGDGGEGSETLLYNCSYTVFKSGSTAVDYLCHGGGLFGLGPNLVPRNQKLRTFGLCQSSVTQLKNGTFSGANITNIKISFNRFHSCQVL